MSTVIPIDEFVNDPGYLGWEPRFFDSPWIAEPVSKFRAEDAERFWFLDFHWPKGTTPLGMSFFEDGYAYGTQLSATTLLLPPSNGLAVRFAGTHVMVARARCARRGNPAPAACGSAMRLANSSAISMRYGENVRQSLRRASRISATSTPRRRAGRTSRNSPSTRAPSRSSPGAFTSG